MFYRVELGDVLSLIIGHYYAVNKFDSDVIVVCEYDGDSVNDSMFYWVELGDVLSLVIRHYYTIIKYHFGDIVVG